jgi:hypothetical protein
MTEARDRPLQSQELVAGKPASHLGLPFHQRITKLVFRRNLVQTLLLSLSFVVGAILGWMYSLATNDP